MKTDADASHVVGGVGRAAQADDGVHLACDTARTVRHPDLDLAVTGTAFKLVQDEEGVGIDIDIDPAADPAILSFSQGEILHEVLELVRPFHW
jgi:hypothetical protein